MKADYLIIGQGLAGSILALQLLERNKRVVIVDNAHASSSSVVAAGMINPLAGKRLAKAWLVDESLHFAKAFYDALAKQFKQQFYFPSEIQKLFKSEEQIERYQKKVNDPAFKAYIGPYKAPNAIIPATLDDKGSFTTYQAGHLEVADFLSAIKKHFIALGCYFERQVDYQKIRISQNGIQLDELSAEHLIFCEGWKAEKNPWFSWLPFNSAKGDIITVKDETIELSRILNNGQWVLPVRKGHLKVGSTYTRDTLDSLPTEGAQDTLLESYRRFVPHSSQAAVVEHFAGVRPLTADNRPFIGRHPEQSQLSIFNGFGSKGALTIPYLAEHFIEHLERGHSLNQEADIQRAWKP